MPIASSPSITAGEACGWQLALSFILSSNYTTDTACISQIMPIDFVGTSPDSMVLAQLYFGTASLWAE
jgi:hypothetical protein